MSWGLEAARWFEWAADAAKRECRSDARRFGNTALRHVPAGLDSGNTADGDGQYEPEVALTATTHATEDAT